MRLTFYGHVAQHFSGTLITNSEHSSVGILFLKAVDGLVEELEDLSAEEEEKIEWGSMYFPTPLLCSRVLMVSFR